MFNFRMLPIAPHSPWRVAMGVCIAFLTITSGAVMAEELAPVAELRLYPTGQIVGGGVQTDVGNTGQAGVLIVYNRARRGDNGRHADERGGGFGIGTFYDHYVASNRLGWSLGGRFDVFALGIDYRDDTRQGRSDVIVLQPTVGAAYSVPVDSNRLVARFGLDVGAELNARTRGAEVGKGAIVLFSVRLSSR